VEERPGDYDFLSEFEKKKADEEIESESLAA